MRLFPVMTAAMLAASCGLASAQATNVYPSPAVAQTFGNADVPNRYDNSRLWDRPGWREPGYNTFGAGYNALGAGVQIGPIGVGVGPAYGYHAGYYGGPGYYASYGSGRYGWYR
jgi:hypothetical protein